MAEVLTPDICVVGGGPGGTTAALAAAAEGVPVVLVEKGAMGGADLASGSIPAAALGVAAEVNALLQRGPSLGVTAAPLQVNLGKVREHVGAVAASIAPNVSGGRLAALGVRVVNAPARFADRHLLSAGEIAIRARRYILATGSVPAIPDIPGLDGVEYATVETAFDLGRKPAHLIVLGAGSEGLQLAQAYNRLGVDATVLDPGAPMPDSDPELVALLVDRLRAEGIRVRTGVRIVSVGRRRGGIRFTVSDSDGGEAVIDGSHLLVAGGRKPNIADLNLAAAGIRHDASGIVVDRNLRTSNRRVYAVGDAVAGPAHAARARYQAGRVVKSILFRLPFRDDPDASPLVAFTDPALASVGLGEAEARRRHAARVRVLRFPFIESERAQIERMPSGMIKVVAGPGGKVLGAAIVGHGAGEMIALWSLAIANRLSLDAVAGFPAPYPAYAAISQRVAAGLAERAVAEGAGLTATWRRRIIELLRTFG